MEMFVHGGDIQAETLSVRGIVETSEPADRAAHESDSEFGEVENPEIRDYDRYQRNYYLTQSHVPRHAFQFKYSLT